MRQQHRNDSKKISTRNPAKIDSIQKEILKTLLYSDLFHYPLTGEQVFQYLGIKVTGKDFLAALKTVPYSIVGRTIYYYLPKHKKHVVERLQKEKWNEKKRQKAKEISQLLRLIPTIRFIGISGSLALKNAGKHDDADLFFICAPHTVWLTRLFVYSMLRLLGVGRKRNKKTSDAICANMFMDQKFLAFQKSKQNIYIAHEITQVVPLFDKKNYFNQLLLANIWVKNYFPNMIFPSRKKKQKEGMFWVLFYPVEYLLFRLQFWYMRQHKTRETTTKNLIAFHPIDYERQTITLYNKKSNAYEI